MDPDSGCKQRNHHLRPVTGQSPHRRIMFSSGLVGPVAASLVAHASRRNATCNGASVSSAFDLSLEYLATPFFGERVPLLVW